MVSEKWLLSPACAWRDPAVLIHCEEEMLPEYNNFLITF